MGKAIVYPKLKVAVKRRWLKALRSGDYKQGHEQLCDRDAAGDNAYCCLGVLCELTKDTVYAGHNAFPPEAVVEKAFVERSLESSRHDGRLMKYGDPFTKTPLYEVLYKLASMNDGINCKTGANMRKYSFPAIAQWIEEKL